MLHGGKAPTVRFSGGLSVDLNAKPLTFRPLFGKATGIGKRPAIGLISTNV
jgi:hypothetical protein